VFSKQDDGLVGWSDAISTNPLMNLEPDEACFSVKLDQTLNAHIARVIEDNAAITPSVPVRVAISS